MALGWGHPPPTYKYLPNCQNKSRKGIENDNDFKIILQISPKSPQIDGNFGHNLIGGPKGIMQ